MVSSAEYVRSVAQEKYVSLTTFKRDGTAVATTVWISCDGTALYVWTQGTSGKVKRIRNNARVSVAPCDVRGRGHDVARAAEATILDRERTREVVGLHRKKYGLQFAFFDSVGRLAGRGGDKNIGIRIVPSDDHVLDQ